MAWSSGPGTTPGTTPYRIRQSLAKLDQVGFYAQEVAVKVLRFRIVSIMLVVAIAALDFVAIRALFGFRSLMGELLILGALPMANVLAVGLASRQRRPGTRPFLLGFVPFGAMALALYVATATSFPREIVVSCLTPVNDYLENIIGPHRPLLFIPAQTFLLKPGGRSGLVSSYSAGAT
jgi:hypothetical protein